MSDLVDYQETNPIAKVEKALEGGTRASKRSAEYTRCSSIHAGAGVVSKPLNPIRFNKLFSHFHLGADTIAR